MWNINHLLSLSFLNRSCMHAFRDIVCTLQIAIIRKPESPGIKLLIVLINLVLAACIYGTLSKQNSTASLLIRRINDVWHIFALCIGISSTARAISYGRNVVL